MPLPYVPAITPRYQQCFLRVTFRQTYTGGVEDDNWPGKKFGLPLEGPRSTPTYLRRMGGLAVDWVIAVAISLAFFDYNGLWTLGIFNLLHMVGGLLFAGSPGHLVFQMRIAPVRGGALGILAPLMRPLLISLVIPAVIVDEDQRGAHDRLVGTILVRR